MGIPCADWLNGPCQLTEKHVTLEVSKEAREWLAGAGAEKPILERYPRFFLDSTHMRKAPQDRGLRGSISGQKDLTPFVFRRGQLP
jgi:hypothetical protein